MDQKEIKVIVTRNFEVVSYVKGYHVYNGIMEGIMEGYHVMESFN